MRFSAVFTILALATAAFAGNPNLPQEIKDHIANHVEANAQRHRDSVNNMPHLFGGVQHIQQGGHAHNVMTDHRNQAVHEHTTAQMLRKNAGPRRTRRRRSLEYYDY
ncbi:hypothetical protein FISHEDRAFT_61898 [Fistulina hepatica ATCC 64428]|uniref:Uncharacterized protein n=1 Tax=Fistulina hepatica ATCC 64428 TaxID=1128425 RepID=A0A0D7A011_9AGAR|nr:hypothetical protein FISHEDRAFT_61898 [Fistulina hepatica ATCC 64428]